MVASQGYARLPCGTGLRWTSDCIVAAAIVGACHFGRGSVRLDVAGVSGEVLADLGPNLLGELASERLRQGLLGDLRGIDAQPLRSRVKIGVDREAHRQLRSLRESEEAGH